MEKHVIPAARVGLAAEEMVKPDLVKSRDRSIGGNVTPHVHPLALRAGNLHGGIPAHPAAIIPFDAFIARESRFILWLNRISERRI